MKLLKSALVVASAGMLLTACGGGDDGNGSTTTPTPEVSCNEGTPSFVTCTDVDGGPDIYTLSGSIDSDFTLDNSTSKEWRLQGTVTVGNGNETTVNSDEDVTAVQNAGVTLTIEPGVHVKAFDTAKLIVTRGSKLMADGTAAAPITFSSVVDENFDGEGEWGGVVVQGFAPQYGARNAGACFGTGTTCNVDGEGGDDIGMFGGNIVADNSGVIRYVRIAEGGLVAGPNNEVNGLTLQGVGYGTTIEYVQVHGNLDDGIEWFGGTVNVKYAVLTNNDDDDIDFDEGYVGNIQHAIIVKNQDKTEPTGSNDPRGVEANSSDEDYVPQTDAVLANITVIGGPVNNNSDHEKGQQPGMRLRGSLTAAVHNSVVEGFDTGCIRIDDSDIDGEGAGTEIVNSTVTLNNVLGDCLDGFYDKRAADEANNAEPMAISFDDAYAVIESAASLQDPVMITAVGDSGFTFDSTDYIGAVAPGTDAAAAWWAGWVLPGTLSESVAAVPAEADFVTCADGICTITGNVDEDYTMVAGTEWRLQGTVTVGNGNEVTVNSDADVAAVKAAGVTLTIEPGVNVGAFDTAKLIVTRGSKLMAEGLPYAPITFSSLVDEDFDGLGEWGGIVVQGFAPQYGAGNAGPCFGESGGTTCNVDGEGGDDIGMFGGNVVEDDSGVIKYVRIAEGGLVAGPNNEVNGLTLQGVGYGTTVEYVQVHGNLDDGIEWFGGTVNVKYAVLTNNDDDDIDFDEGYVGNIQHVLIIKHQTKTEPTGSNDPRGVEANSSDEDYVPQTNAVLANFTVIGGPVNNNSTHEKGEQPGMRLRGSLTASVYNSAVQGFDTGCIRIDDSDTNGDAEGGDIVDSTVNLYNVLGDCEDGFYDKREANNHPDTDSGEQTLTFDNAYAIEESAAQLDSEVAITAVGDSGFVFDSTDYVGAVAPGTAATEAWWAGWTIPGTVQ